MLVAFVLLIFGFMPIAGGAVNSHDNAMTGQFVHTEFFNHSQNQECFLLRSNRSWEQPVSLGPEGTWYNSCRFVNREHELQQECQNNWWQQQECVLF